MKIWLDLRFITDELYSSFIIELVKWIIIQEKSSKFIIYSNKDLKWFDLENCIINNVWIPNNSSKEQTQFNKILKNDKNDLVIFFNHYKPVLYKWEYYTFIPSLKDIYYNNFSNYFYKYLYLFLLEKNLKNSSKVICFDKNTSDELIEKFNINEEKINLINWFFPNKEKLTNIEDLKINIRAKYDIKNNYYIYSWWEWLEKNYEKLVHVFKKLKDEWTNIDLVLLWKNITRNIPLRKIILELNMQKNIHFVSVIKQNEKILFYKNALWTIFPSFYEPFPFRLTEPIYYNSNILASDLKNIKSIFNEQINYFSPISVNSIYEAVKNDLINQKNIINYNSIEEKISKEKTIAQILDIIN
jgi:glycosyltransferase involved in cell wall biosynthesis